MESGVIATTTISHLRVEVGSHSEKPVVGESPLQVEVRSGRNLVLHT